MAVPTLLPCEATALPLGSKRKHAEIADLNGDSEKAAAPMLQSTSTIESHPPAGETARHLDQDAADSDSDEESTHEESDDDDDNDDVLHTILDDIELEPYEHDGTMGLSLEQVAEHRAKLQRVGIETFINEAMGEGGLTSRQLGIVFGLDPNLTDDDDYYLNLLGLVINRAYYKRSKLTQFNTIDDAAHLLQTCKNIMVITGAGISTSLGIPDFRSKGTGFYERVRDMGYEEPEEVFDIRNFDENPAIFYSLAGDILPDVKRFTPTHAFIRLLQDQERLQTNYTQNIDNLEALAGIDENRLIQCHGSFATATCRKCGHKVPGSDIFPDIRAKRVAQCTQCIRSLQAPRPQKRAKSSSKAQRRSDDDADDSNADDDIPQPGIMKPDITFFGEQLPSSFFDRFSQHDAGHADLVIAIGTSLKVAPVSEMPNHLPHAVPHIYISREPIRHVAFDIQLLGNCDDVVIELCRRAGWTLRHEMVPTGFVADVSCLEGSGHCWRVVPAEREIPATDTETSASDSQGSGRPSSGLQSGVAGGAVVHGEDSG